MGSGDKSSGLGVQGSTTGGLLLPEADRRLGQRGGIPARRLKSRPGDCEVSWLAQVYLLLVKGNRTSPRRRFGRLWQRGGNPAKRLISRLETAKFLDRQRLICCSSRAVEHLPEEDLGVLGSEEATLWLGSNLIRASIYDKYSGSMTSFTTGSY